MPIVTSRPRINSRMKPSDALPTLKILSAANDESARSAADF
jgi:hypothetical protein